MNLNCVQEHQFPVPVPVPQQQQFQQLPQVQDFDAQAQAQAQAEAQVQAQLPAHPHVQMLGGSTRTRDSYTYNKTEVQERLNNNINNSIPFPVVSPLQTPPPPQHTGVPSPMQLNVPTEDETENAAAPCGHAQVYASVSGSDIFAAPMAKRNMTYRSLEKRGLKEELAKPVRSAEGQAGNGANGGNGKGNANPEDPNEKKKGNGKLKLDDG